MKKELNVPIVGRCIQMVKDESGSFFTEEAKLKTTDTSNPDIMSKWVGVAEKGINLIDQIVKMRTAKEPKTGGETGAYEKGLSQGLQQATAQAQVQPTPEPILITKEASIEFKSEEAMNYLFDALDKTDKTKTLEEYLNGDLKEAREMGVLKPMVEQFLKNFTELKQ